jgi:hypothetical protein
MHPSATTSLRPFNIVAVVWGREYRDYFLEYCLPSLLAPGNIPAVSRRRPVTYLIATTADDWESMRRTAIFGELERHVSSAYVELPACPPQRPYWMQAVIGHKLCCDIIFRRKAYRIFTAPDSIFADGALARLNDLAMTGAEAVFKLTMPIVDKELFFETLAERAMLPAISARDSGMPIAFSPRQLASAALASSHHMSIVNEWQAPYFCGYAATPWWSVPGEEGIVVHGLSWDIFLLDYAAVSSHDGSILDDRGWDGDYIMRTVGGLKSIHLIQDSDEFNAAGWSSIPSYSSRHHRFGAYGKGIEFRTSYNDGAFNSLHRRLLFFPSRIHAGPLNAKWEMVEQKALQTLLTWVEPPADLNQLCLQLPAGERAELDARLASCKLPWWRRNSLMWAACCEYLMPLVAYFTCALTRAESNWKWMMAVGSILATRLVLLLRGDRAAARWWRWRLRKLSADVRGRPFDEPRPEVPK